MRCPLCFDFVGPASNLRKHNSKLKDCVYSLSEGGRRIRCRMAGTWEVSPPTTQAGVDAAIKAGLSTSIWKNVHSAGAGRGPGYQVAIQ